MAKGYEDAQTRAADASKAAADAAAAAAAANTNDKDNAASSSNPNKGKLVVLVSAFVARTNAKNAATRRYRRGEIFEPVDGLDTDTDALIAAKVLGKVGDKTLTTTNALALTQAAAQVRQESSPVLNLSVQPFEQGPVEKVTSE